MWNVRQCLLKAWGKITLPPSLAHLRDYDKWKRFILNQGKNDKGEDYWHVYFAKPTKNAKQTAKYLGRYLKKPPVASSRLAHYDGGSRVSLRFLDHRTGCYDNLALSQRADITDNQTHSRETFSDDPLLWFSGQPRGERKTATGKKGTRSESRKTGTKGNF